MDLDGRVGKHAPLRSGHVPLVDCARHIGALVLLIQTLR